MFNRSVLSGIFLFFCIICSNLVLSQTVIDSITKKTVPFVEIYNQSNEGIISSEDGSFSLESFELSDSLTFRHIGYSTIVRIVSQFTTKDTLWMVPEPISLKEIQVWNFNPKDTISKVISLINNNHLVTEYQMAGFYREYTKENNKGVSLIEASFLGSVKETKGGLRYQTKVLKGKKTENKSIIGINLEGGPQTLLEIGDILAQRKLLFNLSEINEFDYQLINVVDSGNTKHYEIDFIQNSTDLEKNLMGSLFIDASDLSVIELRCSRDPIKLRKKIIDAELKKPNQNQSYLTQSELLIRFKNVNGQKELSFLRVFNNLIISQNNGTHNIEINGTALITSTSKTSNYNRIKTNYDTENSFTNELDKISNITNWEPNNIIHFGQSEINVLNDIYTN